MKSLGSLHLIILLAWLSRQKCRHFLPFTEVENCVQITERIKSAELFAEEYLKSNYAFRFGYDTEWFLVNELS